MQWGLGRKLEFEVFSLFFSFVLIQTFRFNDPSVNELAKQCQNKIKSNELKETKGRDFDTLSIGLESFTFVLTQK